MNIQDRQTESQYSEAAKKVPLFLRLIVWPLLFGFLQAFLSVLFALVLDPIGWREGFGGVGLVLLGITQGFIIFLFSLVFLVLSPGSIEFRRARKILTSIGLLQLFVFLVLFGMPRR